jgi:hypothetical protein
MKRGYLVSQEGEFWAVGVVASSAKDAKLIAYGSGYLLSVDWIDLRTRWIRTAEVKDLPIGIVKNAKTCLLCGLYDFIEGERCEECGKDDVLKLCAGKALCDECIEKEFGEVRPIRNIYEVISETLYDYECMGYEPPEPYCIAHLVAAKNPSQARYLAWKAGDESTYDIMEMPAFSTHLCRKKVYIGSGIVTNDERFQDCWRDEEE